MGHPGKTGRAFKREDLLRAGGGDRTHDLAITNRLRYQLRHTGLCRILLRHRQPLLREVPWPTKHARAPARSGPNTLAPRHAPASTDTRARPSSSCAPGNDHVLPITLMSAVTRGPALLCAQGLCAQGSTRRMEGWWGRHTGGAALRAQADEAAAGMVSAADDDVDIVTRRGFAFSATGIVTVRTPLS